ncbi:MAG: hypothetical protein H7Y28_10435 [Rhodoferax sp.]|nr:hypothetical protein [Rhodoferax sp.]
MRSRALVLLLAVALAPCAGAADRFVPARDDQVVEVLPTVTRIRPVTLPITAPAPTPASAEATGQAIMQAREAIAVARQTGDTRYWGRAQATLAPWWDRSDAPPTIAILQATVQQGRHEFEPARKLLTAALEREPGNAQGWLNLAALERLLGRYKAATQACGAVARAGQPLYAQACVLETRSLQGHHDEARTGFRVLLDSFSDAGQRSWIYSLWAESEERAGRDRAAAAAYQHSLKLSPDLYTSIAYSDLLLRTGKTSQALQLLKPLPLTDAVLLRQATALRRMGDAGWQPLRAALRERQGALDRRGDDPRLHGRELALVALWLDDDAAQAMREARENLALQREPLDWWVAVQSAHLAGSTTDLAVFAAGIQQAGLVDARLSVPAPKAAERSRP